MARQSVENWIPDLMGSEIYQAYAQTSAVDQIADHEPMAGPYKELLRAGSVTAGVIAKGSAYPESTSTDDTVELRAVKIGTSIRLADEDLVDNATGRGIVTQKRKAMATAVALNFDNAALAVTAARNGTTVPYDSLYRRLTVADANVSYGAGDNVLTATGGDLTYGDLNDLLGRVEANTWTNVGRLVFIADPSWKFQLRKMVDADGRPLWQPPTSAGIADAPRETILGYPIIYTHGARLSATMTGNPTGNPLLFIGDPTQLVVGEAPIGNGMPVGALGFYGWEEPETDEYKVKAAVRRAFNVVNPGTWAVIEKT